MTRPDHRQSEALVWASALASMFVWLAVGEPLIGAGIGALALITMAVGDWLIRWRVRRAARRVASIVWSDMTEEELRAMLDEIERRMR